MSAPRIHTLCTCIYIACDIDKRDC